MANAFLQRQSGFLNLRMPSKIHVADQCDVPRPLFQGRDSLMHGGKAAATPDEALERLFLPVVEHLTGSVEEYDRTITGQILRAKRVGVLSGVDGKSAVGPQLADKPRGRHCDRIVAEARRLGEKRVRAAPPSLVDLMGDAQQANQGEHRKCIHEAARSRGGQSSGYLRALGSVSHSLVPRPARSVPRFPRCA